MNDNLFMTHLFVATLALTVITLICSKRIRPLLFQPIEVIPPLAKDAFFERFEKQMEGFSP